MPDYTPVEPLAPVGGAKQAAPVSLQAQQPSPGEEGATSSAGEGIQDTTDLSAQAQEQIGQLNQQDQAKELTPEEEAKQNELMQKISALIEQMNGLMAKGDIQGAQAVMQEISSLVGSSGIEMPQVTSDGQPSGNVPGAYGDGPAFYPQVGGTSGSYDGGEQGVAPADLSGVKATLPGDGNQNIVNTALDIGSKGYRYVWGGDGPQEGGYDCSGFTHAVYAKNGINIPRTAQSQYDFCKKQGTLFTDIKSAKPGDLIFFDNPYSKKTTPVGHVMIYLGNGKMVGAQSDGVKVYNTASMSKYIVGYGRPKS